MREMENIRIWVVPAAKSADFHLIVNVVDDKGGAVATIGSCGHNEPQKLHDLLQAFRMGQRFPATTK
jgi:hypothetical protein